MYFLDTQKIQASAAVIKNLLYIALRCIPYIAGTHVSVILEILKMNKKIL